MNKIYKNNKFSSRLLLASIMLFGLLSTTLMLNDTLTLVLYVILFGVLYFLMPKKPIDRPFLVWKFYFIYVVVLCVIGLFFFCGNIF